MEGTPAGNGPRTGHDHRGLRGRLAGIFSSSPSPNLQRSEQVAKLRDEVQKQSDLKETYKARLESTQEYLRYCLEVAQEHGFLHLISNDESPHQDDETDAATVADAADEDEQPEAEAPPSDPYLAATRDLAVQHGWSVSPDEIELHELMGQGSTADIHRATWRGLDVAVKWVRPEFFSLSSNGGGGEAFFAQEVELLSRQRHPHVLRLMGSCLRPPDSCFLVTELLSGATLGEWLYGAKERRRRRDDHRPTPTLAERVSRALEIALAMRYLHEQTPRVLHRDLKPSNVLLDGDSRVRVADFGHARLLPDGKAALTGETGTYVYMAPEVIRCEPYTEKCDVYSFGVILNELVTGEHPYIDTSYGPSKIALEVADGKLRPRLPENDANSGALVDLIRRTWHAEPLNRPSFATITSALREIKEQLETSQS